jgi:hypothetical protein
VLPLYLIQLQPAAVSFLCDDAKPLFDRFSLDAQGFATSVDGLEGPRVRSPWVPRRTSASLALGTADGRAAGCDRVRWYASENYTWCRMGVVCAQPSILDAPEVNYCADGHMPLDGVRVNPCDKNVTDGTNFTGPAQQFNVIRVRVRDAAEEAVLYYGERANSAPDGLFSHNFQAWVPLAFDDAGAILPMTFPPSFQLDLVNATA